VAHLGDGARQRNSSASSIGLGAWFGLLVTALSIPIGQLDGGHISYTVFGKRSTSVTLAMIVVAIALSYRSATWIVWTIVVTAMLFAFGVNHPPVLDEDVPLDRSRKLLAVFALVMFALCFTPVPIQELFTGR
jgi:membrane-associated protease RseP (regulator of RpoE activity)